MRYLSHKYNPAVISNDVVWPRVSDLPVVLKTTEGFGELLAFFYMQGGNLGHISLMKEQLKHCIFTDFDDENLKEIQLECFLTETPYEVIGKTSNLVRMKFFVIPWGFPVQAINTGTFWVDGSRKTPATVEICNLTEEAIDTGSIGIGPYRIDELQPGEIIVIDGREKLVSSTAREAIFRDMNFTTFPALEPGQVDLEITQPEGVQIIVKWKPRW